MCSLKPYSAAVGCGGGTGLIFFVESVSELFTDDMSKGNHSPGPVIRGISP